MSQAKIRQARKKLANKLKEVRKQERLILAELKELQTECEHPNMRKYSAMGEVGNICDDCGYQD